MQALGGGLKCTAPAPRPHSARVLTAHPPPPRPATQARPQPSAPASTAEPRRGLAEGSASPPAPEVRATLALLALAKAEHPELASGCLTWMLPCDVDHDCCGALKCLSGRFYKYCELDV